jgi:hypothetical protein
MIVIFNGPPGSGKDEAAYFYKHNLDFHSLSFKHILFKETIKYFNVSKEWFMDDYNNREKKELKEELLGNRSRREAMIYTSEEVIKPNHGKDFFGRQVAKEIQDGVDYVISDGGFVEELIPLIDRVGSNNIILVQLTRDGCNYSSDSRRYFNGNLIKEYVLGHSTRIENKYILNNEPNMLTYRIHNNGTLQEFHNTLKLLYVEIIARLYGKNYE